jgi:hypothetical protein
MVGCAHPSFSNSFGGLINKPFEVDRERYVILPGKRPQSFVRVLKLAVDAHAYLWSESCAPAAAMSPQVSSG